MKIILTIIKKSIVPLFGVALVVSYGDEHNFTPYAVSTSDNTPLTGYALGIIKTTSISGVTPVVTKEIQTYKNITFKGGDEKFIPIEPQDPSDTRGYQLQLRVAGSASNNPTITAPALVANHGNSGIGVFVPRTGRV